MSWAISYQSNGDNLEPQLRDAITGKGILSNFHHLDEEKEAPDIAAAEDLLAYLHAKGYEPKPVAMGPNLQTNQQIYEMMSHSFGGANNLQWGYSYAVPGRSFAGSQVSLESLPATGRKNIADFDWETKKGVDVQCVDEVYKLYPKP